MEPKQRTEKPASADPQPSQLCGLLRVSDDRVTWSEMWATIPTSEPLELVLHLREGSQDNQPPCTIPLSGCKVSLPDTKERLDAGHVWKLQQAQRSWYLSASSEDLQQQWLEALSMASQGDLTQANSGNP